MRRIALTGMFMLAGAGAGPLIASGNYVLASAMGAVAGLTVALMILAFPRDHDYPQGNFWAD